MRFALASVALVLLLLARSAAACSFCCPIELTYTDELAGYEVVVIARLAPERSSKAPPTASIDVVQVIKGKGLIDKKLDSIPDSALSAGRRGGLFLLVGTGAPHLNWSISQSASPQLAAYLRNLVRLPKTGRQRLEFFYRHLESTDESIAYDAHLELSRVAYADLKRNKDLLNHDQLVAWVRDPEMPSSRRRTYLTMLGACGSARDVPLLEGFINSVLPADRRPRDAILTTYLTLSGTEGLNLIDARYLANPEADYEETYCAIMAVRFQLEEESAIPKSRLVASLRLMLQRPELADIVIPDLAKAEDWESIDRLLALYRNAKYAEAEANWVRVPVVNYLRACPLPRAKDDLRECEAIDPEAVKRALEKFEISAPAAKM